MAPPPSSRRASMQAQTRNGSPTPAERKLAPPPETPTRALLQRLRRRSSIVPMPHAFGDEELENEDEEDDDAQDSDEQAALERQIDQLLRKGERKDEKIRALEQRCADMDRDLRMEKEKGKALKERSDKGLTRQAAIKLEREFASQEMILKGLQRDNEEKTIEVESLRRRCKALSDFLARQYGEDDWEGVVAAASSGSSLPPILGAGGRISPELRDSPSPIARVLGGASANSSPARTRPTGNFPSSLSDGQGGAGTGTAPAALSALANAYARSASPLRRALAQSAAAAAAARGGDTADEPASSTKGDASEWMGADQSFVSAYEGEGVGASFSVPPGEIAQPAEPATTNTSTTTNSSNDINGQRPIYDPSAILASIESVRLLVQGFERRNAGRRTELEEMVERALLAEKRAEEFAAASTTTAAASTVAA